MEESKKLSIIIPVYKVEPYLSRCFKSIDVQNLGECEVIFVDDGSPDASGTMCDAYAEGKDFVKVIHKSNGGLSDARNAGIQAARGEYCAFVDSDDALEENACRLILNTLNKVALDVLYLDVSWIQGEKVSEYGKRGFASDTVMLGKKALLKELQTEKYAAMAQIGIYRTDFLRKNSLYFKVGIFHEDEEWSPRVMLEAARVMRVEYPYYQYYIRENSITQTINTKRYLDIIQTVEELKDIYATCGDSKINQYGRQYLAKLYMNAAAHLIATGIDYKIDFSLYGNCMIGIKNHLKALLFTLSPTQYLKQMER